MQQKTNGIVLQNIKFQDKRSILKVYTLQHGLQSYAVTIGHLKSSKIKPAHVIALNQIEFIEHSKQARDVQKISEAHVTYIYQNLFSNPIKNVLAVFLNEVLIKSLREQMQHDDLYRFVTESLIWLDKEDKDVVNFHLHFLIELSKHLGFCPNNNYSRTACIFDMQDGVFASAVPNHAYYVDSEISFHLHELLNHGTDNTTYFTCDGKTRSELLKLLLLLYRLHVPSFGELKSVQVLKEVLA